MQSKLDNRSMAHAGSPLKMQSIASPLSIGGSCGILLALHPHTQTSQETMMVETVGPPHNVPRVFHLGTSKDCWISGIAAALVARGDHPVPFATEAFEAVCARRLDGASMD